jgi:hypothetical protein
MSRSKTAPDAGLTGSYDFDLNRFATLLKGFSHPRALFALCHGIVTTAGGCRLLKKSEGPALETIVRELSKQN